MSCRAGRAITHGGGLANVSSSAYSSRDAEDILLVVDGREELGQELANADLDVRTYMADQFQALLKHRDFDDFLEGNLRGQPGRVAIVRERYVAISHCADAGAHAH
ncbi:hypothetical protein [Rhizobium herbae]|uniref:Uncharacterized protein n=1 Tax=Rhizobium herbae TaxID=508661 RepID=A0ABS4EVX2_9HYPH|nr:hypothetical protein [Rhizobium herbae]MBP1862089.1 hypothetical protein [Rhizobium herbae]